MSRHETAIVWTWRIALLVVVLGAWEYLTGIKAVSRTAGLYWIDPFFISRPSAIVQRFVHLSGGQKLLGKVLESLKRDGCPGSPIGNVIAGERGVEYDHPPAGYPSGWR